jgi:hypothetical protein
VILDPVGIGEWKQVWQGKKPQKRLILWNIRYSINYALALHKANISCELHLCPTGEYGYCMGKLEDPEFSVPAIVLLR